MVPVISNGSSFKGAALYYRHDKQTAEDAASGKAKPRTSDRVGFIETRNLAHDGIDGSLAEMIGVCRAAPLLKERAGASLGRPLTKPVKTIALSWHPDQRPDRTEMIAAADSFLAAMSWQQHQAILIEHTDTTHPHLHVILNRVHPDTGMTLNDSNDRRRAQEWAHQWDASRKQEWCPERAKKYGSKKGGASRRRNTPGIPRPQMDSVHASVVEFTAADAVLEQTFRPTPDEARGLLSKRHAVERKGFGDERQIFVAALRSEVYARLKSDTKADWRGHFRYARLLQQRAAVEAAREQKLAKGLMRSATRLKSEAARQKQLARAEQHLDVSARILGAARDAIADDKAALTTEFRRTLRARQREASAAFTNERYAASDALTARHQDEKKEAGVLIAARDAGRRYDSKRLDALLSPDPIEDGGDIAARIKKLLDGLDQVDVTVERRTRDDQLPFGLAWQRRTSQSMLQDFNALTASLRKLAWAQDQGVEIEPDHQQRLDALIAEVSLAADMGGRSLISRHEPSRASSWTTADAAQRRAIVAGFMQDEAVQGAEAWPLRSAGLRLAEALALYFDPADPIASIGAAIVHDHGRYLEQVSALRASISIASDEPTTQMLELQRQHLMASQLAAVAWRNGRLSEIVVGKFADGERGHSDRTLFLHWSSDELGLSVGKSRWPIYPKMKAAGKATGAHGAHEAFDRHDVARADAAEIAHAVGRRASEMKRQQSRLVAKPLAAKTEAGTAHTQATQQAGLEPRQQWLERLRREQEEFARTGVLPGGERRPRRKSHSKLRRLRHPASTAFRLGDYETTRLWKRGEWRLVTRPPPVATLHARGIIHAGTDCPFCRLDWGRCQTHPR